METIRKMTDEETEAKALLAHILAKTLALVCLKAGTHPTLLHPSKYVHSIFGFDGIANLRQSILEAEQKLFNDIEATYTE